MFEIEKFDIHSSLSGFKVFREIGDTLKQIYASKGLIDIVMIDDSDRDIRMVEDILTSEFSIKFSFNSFRNPIQALQALDEGSILPDLIILDIVIPSMNGTAVLKRIKSVMKTKSIPIIVHSTMNNYDHIRLVHKLEAHAFCPKPINAEYLQKYILNELQ